MNVIADESEISPENEKRLDNAPDIDRKTPETLSPSIATLIIMYPK